MHSKEVSKSLLMLIQDQGQFLFRLFQFANWSTKAKTHKKPQGMYTNMVLWKHGVKSGSAVFHVRFTSHKGPAQKVLSVSSAPTISNNN